MKTPSSLVGAGLSVVFSILSVKTYGQVTEPIYYIQYGERVELKPSENYYLADKRVITANMPDSQDFSVEELQLAEKHGLRLLRRKEGASVQGFSTAVSQLVGLDLQGVALVQNDVDVLLVNEFVIRFQAPGFAERILRSIGAETIHANRTDNWYLVHLPERGAIEGLDLINALNGQRGVAYAYPNLIFIKPRKETADGAYEEDTSDSSDVTDGSRTGRPVALSSEDTWPDDWFFKLGFQQAGLGQVNAPEAWRQTIGACDMRIAILDDGVDVNHEDLKNKIAGSRDLVAKSNAEDFQPSPGDRHGTWVAGVAAAETDNGEGIAGTMVSGGLISVRAYEGKAWADFIPPGTVRAAIDETLNQDARIINGSWGLTKKMMEGEIYDDVEKAIQDGIDEGVVFVFAAGDNADLVEWPARIAADVDIISVGSVDIDGNLLADSNRGPEDNSVTLVAPARQIYTTSFDYGTGSGSVNSDPYYGEFADSSAAAAFVSGAAALLASWHPAATPRDIRDWLVTGSAELPVGAGSGPGWGAGALDIHGSLKAAGTAGITIEALPAALHIGVDETQPLVLSVKRDGTPLSGVPIQVSVGDASAVATTATDHPLITGCDGSAQLSLTAISAGTPMVEQVIEAKLHTDPVIEVKIPISITAR